MSGNKNPDMSVMSKCWKGTHTLSCMNTLLCYRGFKHPSGSGWARVLENTLSVVFKDRCICMNMFCRWAVPSWPSFPSFLTSSLSPPLLSPLCISRIPAHLSSFFTSPTTFCKSLFLGFTLSLSWHKTFTHRFRGMSGMRPFLQHHVVVAHKAATAGPEERKCFCRAHGWTDG